MKKRVFIDKPDEGARGQYTFFDDDATNYTGSVGIPADADKFADKSLYTTVQEDVLNDAIVEYKLQYPGTGYVKIDELEIRNAGHGRRHKSCAFRAYIFDNFAYAEGRTPIGDSYNQFWDNKPDGAGFWRYYPGNIGRNGSPGMVLDSEFILSGSKDFGQYDSDGDGVADTNHDIEEYSGAGAVDDFDSTLAFGIDRELPGFGNDIFKSSIESDVSQTIYVVIWTRGDDRRGKSFWKWTDRRRKRLHIFSFNSDQLFDNTGAFKTTTLEFKYSDATKKEGGGGHRGFFGGADAPAFMVTKLKLTINTQPTALPQENLDPEIKQLLGSVQTPRPLDTNAFSETFLDQHPSREVSNQTHLYPYEPFTAKSRVDVANNFDPVAKVKILENPQYDFQAYQKSSIHQQVCSAPGQISLDFDISDKFDKSNQDLNNDKYNPGILGYMFYVIDWDDKVDKFKSTSDFLSDSPENFFELLEKRKDNLYNFSPVGKPLIHNYRNPGIKKIKCILFSHTIHGMLQAVRWKFITIRVFLDIPISSYPDFGQLGGSDYTTLPWPNVAPIIGGIDKNSKYYTSMEDTLSGGKLDDTDIIDQRFLVKALENDEQGQSINKFDLEQVRYFTTGSYNMYKLLGIENESLNVNQQEYLNNLPFPQYFEEFDIETDIYQGLDANDQIQWVANGRPDIAAAVNSMILTDQFGTPTPSVYDDIIYSSENTNYRYIPPAPEGVEPKPPSYYYAQSSNPSLVSYSDSSWWNCEDWNEERTKCFSDETSVGEIFIDDNLHLDLKQNCKLELNTAKLSDNTILDTSGEGSKGILIGDYKIKKQRKGDPMRRDSYIRLPKKNSNTDGAL